MGIWGLVSRPDFGTGLRVNILGREAVVRRERGHRSDETNGIASSLGLGGGRDARWILAPPDPEITVHGSPAHIHCRGCARRGRRQDSVPGDCPRAPIQPAMAHHRMPFPPTY